MNNGFAKRVETAKWGCFNKAGNQCLPASCLVWWGPAETNKTPAAADWEQRSAHRKHQWQDAASERDGQWEDGGGGQRQRGESRQILACLLMLASLHHVKAWADLCLHLRVSAWSYKLMPKEQKSWLCHPWWQGKRWNLKPSLCTESSRVSRSFSLSNLFIFFTLFAVWLTLLFLLSSQLNDFFSNWNVKCCDWKQT